MKVLAVFVLVLLLFSITPVNAAGEINPSVETIPLFCRYTLTKWTPLCDDEPTIIKGTQNMTMNMTMNQTPNMTSGAGLTDSQYLWVNGSRAMEGRLNMSIFNITIKNITAATDAVNKSYVDSLSGNDHSWNESYFPNDASRKITGTTVYRNVDNDFIRFSGGSTFAGGSYILMNGANRSIQAGYIILATPNAGLTSLNTVLSASGKTNTPSLYFNSLPSGAQTSALCFNSTSKEVTYNSGVTTCTASSEKLKKNKAAVNSNLTAKLMNLTPKTYTLELDGETHYGLLAEEVATVFPELAAHNNGNMTDYSGVRYEEFTAVLLKGFQEQQKTLDAICAKHPNDCGK